MHITILVLYGLTIWVSAISYAAIAGTWRISYVVIAGPIIISTAVTVLAIADMMICAAISRLRIRTKSAKEDRRAA